VICLAGDDPQYSKEIELHGRCVALVYPVTKDGIPAIMNPKFTTPEFTGIPDSELVIGVSINGAHRAYSVPHLGSREVVNNVVGGRAVTVTW